MSMRRFAMITAVALVLAGCVTLARGAACTARNATGVLAAIGGGHGKPASVFSNCEPFETWGWPLLVMGLIAAFFALFVAKGPK